ncbi:hypothetical protein Tco_0556223 [Tanacetum coccineum]
MITGEVHVSKVEYTIDIVTILAKSLNDVQITLDLAGGYAPLNLMTLCFGREDNHTARITFKVGSTLALEDTRFKGMN